MSISAYFCIRGVIYTRGRVFLCFTQLSWWQFPTVWISVKLVTQLLLYFSDDKNLHIWPCSRENWFHASVSVFRHFFRNNEMLQKQVNDKLNSHQYVSVSCCVLLSVPWWYCLISPVLLEVPLACFLGHSVLQRPKRQQIIKTVPYWQCYIWRSACGYLCRHLLAVTFD